MATLLTQLKFPLESLKAPYWGLCYNSLSYMDPLTHLPLSSGSKVISYADDIVLYRPINGHTDVTALQSDINTITNWLSTVGPSLNTSKQNSSSC